MSQNESDSERENRVLEIPEFHPDPLPKWALNKNLSDFERASLEGDTVQRKQNDWIIRTLASGHSRFAKIEQHQDQTDKDVAAVKETLGPIAATHAKFSTIRGKLFAALSLVTVGLLMPLAVLMLYERMKTDPKPTQTQTEKAK